ncbi:uncharacterized protein MELLADRAFT_92157 [Melampsora larici-populina 98AG31]|uniref:Uncharacterized protein n=1 Tax=Melampsora larici-populina (strain 98AG31 / pathotype 3-4-7) TaxID=747676 RepID=F4S1Q1_MELLP|nr:uncharacterized protein MELLADRAFT_92157 [Melampsora larici-populina 98AG31]EGG01466.1 hypothetical protein MELLADRAFT_92157 [Melampsora larici-populina 98AG31]
MLSPNRRVTRSTRTNRKHRTSLTIARSGKRPRQVVDPVTVVTQGPDAPQPGTNHFQTPSATHATEEVNLSEITLQNYHHYKKFWPLACIEAQLARQRSSNHQISAAVIAEGQAVLESLNHTLHMIAMVSGVGITKLKRSLGLLGGTHGENPWHRWLSFAIDANKHPMPQRGDPFAAKILSRRNTANSDAYQALDDDKYAVFTSNVFYALGGYPDYSAVTITEDSNVFGDSTILVPEKVARDRELNTPAASAHKEEKRSLQCMKKIAQQLARDHQLFGLDYYIIACSNSSSGGGWCQEYTSRDEMSQWVSTKADLQHVFPLYCQNGNTFKEIQSVVTSNNPPATTHKVSNNQSDIDKKTLGVKLNGLLDKLLVDVPSTSKSKIFPRVPDPTAVLKARNVEVERAADSLMTKVEFQKGFNGMDAKGRRNWISDIDSGKFRVRLTGASAIQDIATGASVTQVIVSTQEIVAGASGTQGVGEGVMAVGLDTGVAQDSQDRLSNAEVTLF